MGTIEDALALLDEIRGGGRMGYSDYSALHDAISEIEGAGPERLTDIEQTYYVPLTPELRRKTMEGIDCEIMALKTCEPNSLVNLQINAWEVAKKVIGCLPDGHPMPMTRRR